MEETLPNFFADYHVHSDFSGDGEAPMESMIETALAKGLQELVFTDHVDYDYADPVFEMIDYDHYVDYFAQLRDKYQGKIKLLLGVEVGFQPHVQAKIEQFVSSYPFDFVILSTHMADGLDFYTGEFFAHKEQKAAYLRYFENVLESIKRFDNYDVYGHLDFIVRYGSFAVKKLAYADFQDIIDEILKNIIQRGHGIELNTSGYRYGLEQMHPQFEILKRYKDLGGEIITVGSDAHREGDLCAHFDEAYAMLKAVGFRQLTVYRERKPGFIDLI